MRPDELICSRTFRETVLGEYPALRGDRALRRLFAYLAFGTWRCRHTENLMIPAELLAHLEEKESLLRHRNYCAERFLDAFRAEVAPLTVMEAVWVAERCRTVAHVDWSPRVRQAIWGEREQRRRRGRTHPHVGDAPDEGAVGTYSPDEALVFFVDGARVTGSALSRKREALRKEALDSIARAGCPDAEKLLDYLNSRSPNRYTSLLGNLDAATEAALLIPEGRAREHALDTLAAIRDNPMPFYQASPRGKTVRVFPLTASLLTLHTGVRRRLTPHWIDLDLKNAQAAIVARDWRIESLQSFLEGGGKLWQHLMTELGVPEERHAQFKPALKDALYATMFGAEERNICWHLSRDARQQGLGRSFLDLPLLQDILAARERRMAEVIAAGGAKTIYGTWVPLPSDCDLRDAKTLAPVRSLLAQCAQATEMKLLAPVIDLAMEWDGRSSGFAVTLWQHDGFSFLPRKREEAERWTHRLQCTVQEQAEGLGYSTALEVATRDEEALNASLSTPRRRKTRHTFGQGSGGSSRRASAGRVGRFPRASEAATT